MNQKIILSSNGMPPSIVEMVNEHDYIFDLKGTNPKMLKVLRNDSIEQGQIQDWFLY